MSDRIDRLTKRLEQQGARTVEFFLGLRGQDWDRTVYTDGANWKIQEVLKHFLSSERGLARLIELIVQGGAGVPEDFNLDEYNERKVTQLDGLSPKELLDQFSEARTCTVSMVSGFSEDDLDKVGRHPFLGQSSVESMVQLMYRHNQIHQRELRRFLSKSPE